MKALISGAGIAGLALAQRLESHGWEVLVVERAPGPRNQGYMLDFFGPGYDAAEAMGVLPRLKELSYRVEEVDYIDSNGRRRARMDYALFARLVNARLLALLRPDLEMALREQLTNRVELRFGSAVTAIENSPTGVAATLSDGARIDADLLVGADGIHSNVRRLVFGTEDQFFRYLGFQTAAYLFDDSETHARLGDRFCMTDSAMRMMGLYGLRDGRVAAFCAHRARSPILPANPRAELQQRYGSLGWLAPRALDRCPPAAELYYDQVAQVVVPEWSRQRVTLVGDACQAVSLLAGQGASLAVAGSFVLGEQLADASSIDIALTRYEKIWRPVVEEKQRVGRRGTEWFLPKTATQLWMRRIMLAAGSLPMADRFIGAELVGKSNVRIADLLRPDTAPTSSLTSRTPLPTRAFDT